MLEIRWKKWRAYKKALPHVVIPRMRVVSFRNHITSNSWNEFQLKNLWLRASLHTWKCNSHVFEFHSSGPSLGTGMAVHHRRRSLRIRGRNRIWNLCQRSTSHTTIKLCNTAKRIQEARTIFPMRRISPFIWTKRLL